VIRIVWGTGSGPTGKASFDAALADANVHGYNLRVLSSVIPAGVAVDEPGTAPDLGPTGGGLDVVLARQTSPPGTRAAAGLAWIRDDDETGIFYEAADHDPATVREQLQAGIDHGCSLRGIEGRPERRVAAGDPVPEAYTTAVVLAAYGESEPLC